MLSLSEPHVLNALSLYQDSMPQRDLDRLVLNSVRMLCKPINRPIRGYVMKTTAPAIYSVPVFMRLFPQAKHLFMYREGLEVGSQSIIVWYI